MNVIHISEFPIEKTYVKVNKTFSQKILNKLKEKYPLKIIGQKVYNNKYGKHKKLSLGNIIGWFNGSKYYKNRLIQIYFPLWALIRICNLARITCLELEKNIISYKSWGKFEVQSPKLPIKITPELVSLIFHFYGDGHIGPKGDYSHYRQMNNEGLKNVHNKIVNCFGKFNVNYKEFKNGKLIVPKIVTHILQYYFKIGDCYTKTARITEKIKMLPKEFLIAGINAFIVDEGHIGNAIEIYSSNKNLLSDIKEICDKLNYKNNGIKEKLSKVRTLMYRLNLSLKSIDLIKNNTEKITKKYKTCDLAHKQSTLNLYFRKKPINSINNTKFRILNLLSKPKSVNELFKAIPIRRTTIQEHLNGLKNDNLIKRSTICGRFFWEKI